MAKAFVSFAVILHCVILHKWICSARNTKSEKVFPALIEQRSSEGELTLKINEDLLLNLQKTSVFPDTLQLSYYDGDSMLVQNVRAAVIEKDLYHDAQQGAALMVSNTDGVRVEGILGVRLRISPMDTTERNSAGNLAHRIFEVNLKHPGEDDMDPLSSNTFFVSTNASIPSDFTPLERVRKEILATIRPEVHLLIDSELTRKLKKASSIARYYAVFVAFVNLKFKTLQYWLDVQLVITKITTYSQGKDSFVKKARGNESITLISTLDSLEIFMKNKEEFEDDDIVILLTGYDQRSYLKCVRHKDGQSGSFQALIKPQEKLKVENNSTLFTRLLLVMHCLCLHVLGMYHDGDNRGAPECKSTGGYIMAPSQGLHSVHTFSWCSSKQLYNFISKPYADCLSFQTKTVGKALRANAILKQAVPPQKVCELNHRGERITHIQSFTGSNVYYDLKRCDIICYKNDTNYFHFYDAPDNTKCSKDDPSLV
ncbi:unnamed protein product, partial [Ixodes pacificus]